MPDCCAWARRPPSFGITGKATRRATGQPRTCTTTYAPDVVEFVLSEPPALVHGDFQESNVFVEPEAMTVRFLDFDSAAIRAGTSEFMYLAPDGSPHLPGPLLDFALRCYWEASGLTMTFEQIQVCQLYWYGSCWADILSWPWYTGDTLDDSGLQDAVQYAQAIRHASGRIGELRHTI